MGDLRNKLAKIERAKAEKAAFEAFDRRSGWTPPKPEAPSHMLTFVCRGCLRNHMEVKVYFVQVGGHWGHTEYWCWSCMPANLKEGT